MTSTLFSGSYTDRQIQFNQKFSRIYHRHTYKILLQVLLPDNVTEGPTNLYFNDERVDDRVAALINAGVGITLKHIMMQATYLHLILDNL